MFLSKEEVIVKISIIIPTLNAAPYLTDLLPRLNGQSQKIEEIIIVDSQSTDDTIKIGKQYGAQIIPIERTLFDHGGTRNLAFKKAIGDIIIFMTQDALPQNKETIKKLIQPFADIKVAVSYARQIAKPEAKITDRFLRSYNYPAESIIKTKTDIPKLGIKVFQSSNVCAAYDRKIFEKLQGFPQPLVCNEDMLFAKKALLADYKVVYNAEAVVIHSHNYNYRTLFKRYFDIGASLSGEKLVDQLGKTETKGAHFVISQCKFLWHEKKMINIADAVGEAVFKFCGYKLGKNHHKLPTSWKKMMGLNKTYWRKP